MSESLRRGRVFSLFSDLGVLGECFVGAVAIKLRIF